MNNYDYPIGADNGSAPWNEKENPSVKIPVTVSITMSKDFEIDVDDYKFTEEWDDDFGTWHEANFTNCDLKQAVRDQIFLPDEFGDLWKKVVNKEKIYGKEDILKDISNWCVDDFEVVTDI